MKEGNLCISICASSAEELNVKIRQAEALADVVEVRFDCLKPDEVTHALRSLPSIRGRYLITYRPSEQGGKRVLSRSERIKFWALAGQILEGTDVLVDHELDLHSGFGFPPDRIIRSEHYFQGLPEQALIRNEAITDPSAEILKIAATVSDAPDALPLWKLLRASGDNGKRCIPIAMGEAGKWTRILGPAHGAFLTYASLDEEDRTAPGQITAGAMNEVYRVNKLDTETEVFGIIAGDTSYSMSPYIQNAAFRESKMNRVFVPFQVLDIGEFMGRMVSPLTREIDLNFRGFAVTNPHKGSVIGYLDAIDETAERIGAVNTIKLSDDKVIGFNTDADGFIKPLLEIVPDLRGARVSVLGSGGAARACIYALKNTGADVELLARDPHKAKALAEEFGIESAVLSDEPSKLETDIIVNATPLGTRGQLENQMPIRAELLSGINIVYDLTYNPRETLLLREARAAGCRTIDGLEMLIAQGAKQFEIWTGTTPDTGSMRNAALKILAK